MNRNISHRGYHDALDMSDQYPIQSGSKKKLITVVTLKKSKRNYQCYPKGVEEQASQRKIGEPEFRAVSRTLHLRD